MLVKHNLIRVITTVQEYLPYLRGAPGATGEKGIEFVCSIDPAANFTFHQLYAVVYSFKLGDAGEAGLAGTNGLDGAPGKDGAPGLDGAPGKDGINGKDGENGKDGLPGPAGPTGEEGAPGKDGLQFDSPFPIR